MKTRFTILLVILSLLCCGCARRAESEERTLKIISWGGISADKADTMYFLAKECGFNTHLGLYSTQENALLSMDAAQRAGIGIIINFPQLKDSTESAVALIKGHPALVAYHIKDEPVAGDYPWLKSLSEKIASLDPSHPCYINLLPNWSWGVEEYSEIIEDFASEFNLPTYSFDNYPIVEVDGVVHVRSDWYRNLEEFSAMARGHDKPFWAFVLAKSHGIVEPEVAFYPEPTLGHLRLQVYSNLLYGAQAIQYFNFTGIVDPVTCQKKPAFDLIRQVNSEVRAYSSVFAGCTVLGVWHMGDSIPSGTTCLSSMPHDCVKTLSVSHVPGCDENLADKSSGAVVSMIENAGDTYLAVQNRSCLLPAALNITFASQVERLTIEGLVRFDGRPLSLDPGDVAIFKL